MKLCHCQHPECNATIPANVAEANGWARVTLNNRGGRAAYLCPLHANNRGNGAYAQENGAHRGTQGNDGCTYSIELEMHRPSATMRAEVLNVGFLPTSDVTTDCEFKSPIYNSLRPLPKKLRTIEQLLAQGHGAITSADGTHFHVGHVAYINAETMNYIRRFYHSLFVPLSDHMRENPEAVRALFGRNFGEWAQPVSTYTYATRHENFINTQHDATLEYRICKFVTTNQYMLATKFCRAATLAVISNFVLHFYDTPKSGTRTEYRRHKAQVAAGKLVKLFDKYAAAALEL